MKETDDLWINTWSKTRYPPLVVMSPGEEIPLCRASCAYSMGKYFKENMIILDYGCGYARFANFMAQRLDNFIYCGLEIDTEHGRKCIKKAQEIFKNDQRIKLGFTGDTLEKEAIEIVNVALLTSVFTHLPFSKTREIVFKLLPIVKRGGGIIFTIIHADEYETAGPGQYGLTNAYRVTYNTMRQVNELSDDVGYKIELKDIWYHTKKWVHSIYLISE